MPEPVQDDPPVQERLQDRQPTIPPPITPDPEPISPTQEPISPTEIPLERRLPTMKEILPSRSWSADRSRGQPDDGPVHLGTRNPQYVTYFGSIKRAIEAVWQYPPLALQYGLQGKLSMEFTISESGQLEEARILRSSGSDLLDDEALRAVRTAAPFSPIPPWIGRNQIEIIATFEYHDNRTSSRLNP